MKKLMLIWIIVLLNINTYGQTFKSVRFLQGETYDPLSYVSECELTTVRPYFNRSHQFTANGKTYMISYEPYQSKKHQDSIIISNIKTGKRIKFCRPDLNSGDTIKRNLRLYRLDDTINMVWNLASDDIIDTDYNYFVVVKSNYIRHCDIYFNCVDNEKGSYVNILPNDKIEINILRHRNNDYESDRFDPYFHKIILKPIGNEMYKIITIK